MRIGTKLNIVSNITKGVTKAEILGQYKIHKIQNLPI